MDGQGFRPHVYTGRGRQSSYGHLVSETLRAGYRIRDGNLDKQMIKALKGIETAFVMFFMAISCNDVDSFMFENAEQVAGFPVSVSL